MEKINPSQVFNYDEANLSDDPGVQKVCRGTLRVERVKGYSNSSVSIMVCGCADETLPPNRCRRTICSIFRMLYFLKESTLLPSPMVVYRVANIFENSGAVACLLRGPVLDGLNTGSTEFLKKRPHLDGKIRALIGDNLGYHFHLTLGLGKCLLSLTPRKEK